MKWLALIFICAATAISADTAPQQGGEISEYIGPTPKSLNYYLDNNISSAKIFSLMYETLLTLKPDTIEQAPNLACKWEISEDLREYTFWLDPEARWSDGQPVTAEDVVWTWQAIINPKNLTGPHRYMLERTYPPEIVDDGKAVKFTAKEIHWQTINAIGGFEILPRHIFENKNFNEINFDFPVVSGPFRIGEFSEGKWLIMEKNQDWWQKNRDINKGFYNFDRLKYLYFEDSYNAFDAFLRGEIDVFAVYSAIQWKELDDREVVRNGWIVKQSLQNSHPIGMQGFVMNMRREPFNDRRMRQALAHLLDRELLNRTMMHNQYFMHRSYWEDLYDNEHPCNNQFYDFNPQKAQRLLQEAGWQISPETGLLTKNGRPLEFCFLSSGGSQDRFLTHFDKALKNLGITLKIKSVDWSAWSKSMDEFDFDMTWAAWGAGLFKDPEQLWHSKEGRHAGGSNLAGYNNPEVDSLIEMQRGILDVEQRNDILRKIDKIITDDCPYVLLWNTNACRFVFWNKFNTTKTPCGKFGTEPDLSRWSYDLDKFDELKDAMIENMPLPRGEGF